MSFNSVWGKISTALSWIFREAGMQFGEIELLHGDHEVLLPLGHYCRGPRVREVWTSVEGLGGGHCCDNDGGVDYVSSAVDPAEGVIRLRVHAVSKRVLVRWFVVS